MLPRLARSVFLAALLPLGCGDAGLGPDGAGAGTSLPGDDPNGGTAIGANSGSLGSGGGDGSGAGGNSSGAASGSGGFVGSGAAAGDGGTGADTASGGSDSGGATSGGGTSGGGSGGATGGSAGDATCNLGTATGGAPPTPLGLSGNTFAHDPTMIQVGSTYYRFWTGNNIQRSTSSNLTQWSGTSTVYSSTPAWVTTWLSGVAGQTFNFPWAPDVSSFGGKVHLYPSYSAKFGDNISCIGHFSTDNIAGNSWTDHGALICTQGSENYNAIDADFGQDTSGNGYLSFGSFWDGIFVIPLNADGSRKGTSMTRLAWASQIEAPVLFYRCGYYYLFVTWGLCCPGEGRTVDQLTYRVAVGRSANILGPYVDKNGTSMISGGGSLIVQGDDVTWAAAGHSDVMVSGSKIYHTYHAYAQSNGAASLRIVELQFDSAGWPRPHSP